MRVSAGNAAAAPPAETRVLQRFAAPLDASGHVRLSPAGGADLRLAPPLSAVKSHALLRAPGRWLAFRQLPGGVKRRCLGHTESLAEQCDPVTTVK